VNFRLIDFFVFDLSRSMSSDMHESGDFKLNNSSLEASKKAFFNLLEEISSKSLFSATKSANIYPKDGLLLYFRWKTPWFDAIHTTKIGNNLLRAEQVA